MDDELYWRSTPDELTAVLEVQQERLNELKRQAARRAGLVASAVYNVHRNKGQKPLTPDDFVGEPEPMITDKEKIREEMIEWAKSVNRQQQTGEN